MGPDAAVCRLPTKKLFPEDLLEVCRITPFES